VTSSTTKYEVGEESGGGHVGSSGTPEGASGVVSPSTPTPSKSQAAAVPERPKTLSQSGVPAQTPTASAAIASGKTEQMLEAIRQLQQQAPKGVSEQEMIANFISTQQQIIQACDAVLKADSAEQVVMEAAQYKVSALAALASQRVDGAQEQLMQFAQSLEQHALPSVAQFGRQMAFTVLMNAFATDQVKDSQTVIDAFQQLIQSQEKNEQLLTYGQRVATLFMQKGLQKEGAELLRFVADAFQDSQDPRLMEGSAALREQARFADLDLGAKLQAVTNDTPGALEAWAAALNELVSGQLAGVTTLSNLIELAGGLEPTTPAAAAKIYDAIELGYAQNPNPQLAEAARASLDKYHRRTGLLGQPFAVEGVLADGTPFDWGQYKDKVVLVDFWATWCGPCLAELPNIRKNFDRYHAHGFEVVGVNIDSQREDFQRFMALQELPWPNVLSVDPAGVHPMVTKCGIESIPFLVLVGRDGTAIELNLRGAQLSQKLAELFPDVKVTDEPLPSDAGDDAPPAQSNSRVTPSSAGEFYFTALQDNAEVAADGEQADAAEGLDLKSINPYAPRPGLTTAELVDFIVNMQEKPQTIQRRDGFATAIAEAADRILAAEATQQQQILAVTAKLEALHSRAADGDEAADTMLLKFVAQLQADAREKIAAQVAFYQLERRVLNADELPAEQLPGLLTEVQAYLREKPLGARHLRLASATVAAINRLDAEQREQHFQQFGGLFAKSTNKELANYGQRVARTKPRAALDLIDQPIELTGVTALGTAFDWASYRGRVVLVEFWATWCGPCRSETAQLKTLHEQLRRRGFDVVAVSLDQDLEALAKYLQDNELPWANLVGEESAALAKRYGVVAIPTMFVVNAEGTVVAVGHQLEELRDDIEQLLDGSA